MLDTPIAFIIFKRWKETSLVFEEIRRMKPSKLFIIADGPRNDEEKKLCEETRKIVEKIDWQCEIYRDYSNKNLGCRERVVSGLDWVFESVDRAIILEDDCLPDQSFFRFSEELLEKYKDNENIMHIGGTNFQQNNPKFLYSISNDSYYFSNIAQIWGWATWKRAWNKYDKSMLSWSRIKNLSEFKSYFPSLHIYQYWKDFFEKMSQNKFDTWDIAWTYACFKEKGLCIMPKVNLIENIGSSDQATHKINNLTHISRESIELPLYHPSTIMINSDYDFFTYKKVYGIKNNLFNSIKSYMKEYLPSFFKYIKFLMK